MPDHLTLLAMCDEPGTTRRTSVVNGSGSHALGGVLQIGDDRLQNFEGRDLIDRLNLVYVESRVEDVLVHLFGQHTQALDAAGFWP